jgi:two-component system, NarL family, nitrate/nitrite response regulator NarL
MAKTILIVDDSADIRRAVCDLFKREQDFMVCGEAANGREGIVKALELHPDLIVLDLSTPCARAALGETPASPATALHCSKDGHEVFSKQQFFGRISQRRRH